MRLHSLHLQNFRGVTDRRVDFPDRGVVIVQGPNEVGKTSMMEALDLLLNEKDSTKKQAVKDVQPVGQDVGAAVTAEISAGKYRFIYSKQWLKNSSTELRVLQPTPAEYAGVEAHDLVTQMLSESVDLELFEALRVMQGSRVDEQAELRGNSALRAALEAASGTALSVDAKDENLVKAIEGEYRIFFTASGRPTGEYRAAENAVAEAEAEVAAARADLAEAEEQIAKHERLVAESQTLEQTLAQARERLLLHQKRFAELEEHRGAVSEAEKVFADAEERLQAARQAHTERAALKAEHEARKSDAKAKQQQHARARDQVAAATKELEQRLAEAADLEAAFTQQHQAVLGLEKALAAVEARADYERESKRLSDLVATRARLDSAVAALERFRVDDALLDRIIEADKQVQIAETVVNDTAAQIAITTAEPEPIAIDGGEARLYEPRLQVAVTKAMSFEVGNNVTIEVTPAQGAEQRVGELNRARQELTAVLAEADVDDVAAARESNSAHRKYTAQKAAAEAQLAGLEGSDSESGLRARVELLKAKAADPSGGESLDAETLTAELTRMRGEFERAEETLKEAQDAHLAAQEAFNDARIAAAGAKSEWDSAVAESERAGRDLAEAEGSLESEELDEALAVALLAHEKAQESLEAKRVEFAQHDPETVAELLENSEKSVARLENDLAELRNDISHSQGQLELIGSQGRQEALDQALTAQEAAQQKYDRIARHARAAQILHDTVQRHQQETWQRYVAPFQERITGLGRLVFGPDVHFDVSPELEIISRTLGGQTVNFPALSTGAQEQIGILTRLACAQLVSTNGAVPVMIDDALGNSDPARLEGLGAVLTRAGKDAQVIVLTCSPERYRDVGEAEVIRL